MTQAWGDFLRELEMERRAPKPKELPMARRLGEPPEPVDDAAARQHRKDLLEAIGEDEA